MKKIKLSKKVMCLIISIIMLFTIMEASFAIDSEVLTDDLQSIGLLEPWDEMKLDGNYIETHEEILAEGDDILTEEISHEEDFNYSIENIINIMNTTPSKISSGIGHTLALAEDNTVWAWGWNFDGQLGDGSNANKLTPTKINIDNVISISAGYQHSMALKEDGSVWAWVTKLLQ